MQANGCQLRGGYVTPLHMHLDPVLIAAIALACFVAGAAAGLWLGNVRRNKVQADLAMVQQQLGDAFKALSADALQANNEHFLTLAKERLERAQDHASADLGKRQQAIDGLVKPIADALSKVDQKIEILERHRAGAYEGLHAQVRGMMDAQTQLRGETRNLANAMRMPNIRGRWGELQLERTLEFTGLVENVHFELQTTLRDGDGSGLRPDAVIRLPGDKVLVIDAKAPMENYLKALETNDDDARLALLRDHARQIRKHVQALAAKSYWKQFSRSPEFVILFIPGEAFFSAALEQDPELISFGSAQNVMLATPTTLIGLLKVVSHGWRQEAIAEQAMQIAALGHELHERMCTQLGHYATLGKALDKAVDAYNKNLRSMETRVLVSARKFEELLPNSDKELPSPETVDRLSQPPSSGQSPS